MENLSKIIYSLFLSLSNIIDDSSLLISISDILINFVILKNNPKNINIILCFKFHFYFDPTIFKYSILISIFLTNLKKILFIFYK